MKVTAEQRERMARLRSRAKPPAGFILVDGEPMAYWTKDGKPIPTVSNLP